MTKPRNGVGGWIVLAAICLGGSTGGAFLRPQAPHNPDITTAGWIKMTATVERLDRELTELSRDVRRVLRLVAQQPAQKGP